MPDEADTDEGRVSALRRRIQAGEYAVNANSLATTIVHKLREINRARQLIVAPEDDRSPRPASSSHPGGESGPPDRPQSGRSP